MTEPEFHTLLSRSCQAAGGQKAWGADHGFHLSYVNDVIKGRRPPSDRMLEHFGLKWSIERCEEA
jgi:hypothetical protein